MKTAEQILEENKSRMANVITLGAAHARIAGLFFHFTMYNLLVELENCGRNNLTLKVYCEEVEEKELVDAILNCYNMINMVVELRYLKGTNIQFVKISCKY